MTLTGLNYSGLEILNYKSSDFKSEGTKVANNNNNNNNNNLTYKKLIYTPLRLFKSSFKLP